MSRNKARRFEKKKTNRKTIAHERIEILLELAEKQAVVGDQELADRYAQMARKIGMRYKVTMPRGFNIRFCKRCMTYLVFSKNARVRMTGGKLTRQCLKCGSYYRISLGRK